MLLMVRGVFLFAAFLGLLHVALGQGKPSKAEPVYAGAKPYVLALERAGNWNFKFAPESGVPEGALKARTVTLWPEGTRDFTDKDKKLWPKEDDPSALVSLSSAKVVVLLNGAGTLSGKPKGGDYKDLLKVEPQELQVTVDDKEIMPDVVATLIQATAHKLVLKPVGGAPGPQWAGIKISGDGILVRKAGPYAKDFPAPQKQGSGADTTPLAVPLVLEIVPWKTTDATIHVVLHDYKSFTYTFKITPPPLKIQPLGDLRKTPRNKGKVSVKLTPETAALKDGVRFKVGETDQPFTPEGATEVDIEKLSGQQASLEFPAKMRDLDPSLGKEIRAGLQVKAPLDAITVLGEVKQAKVFAPRLLPYQKSTLSILLYGADDKPIYLSEEELKQVDVKFTSTQIYREGVITRSQTDRAELLATIVAKQAGNFEPVVTFQGERLEALGEIEAVIVTDFKPVRVKLDLMDERTAKDVFGSEVNKHFYIANVRIYNNLRDDVSGQNLGKSILAYSGSIETRVALEKQRDDTKQKDKWEDATPVDVAATRGSPLDQFFAVAELHKDQIADPRVFGEALGKLWDQLVNKNEPWGGQAQLLEKSKGAREQLRSAMAKKEARPRIAELAADLFNRICTVCCGDTVVQLRPAPVFSGAIRDKALPARTRKEEIQAENRWFLIRYLGDPSAESSLFTYRPYTSEIVIAGAPAREGREPGEMLVRYTQAVFSALGFATATNLLKEGSKSTANTIVTAGATLLSSLQNTFPNLKDLHRQNMLRFLMSPTEEVSFGGDINRVIFFPKGPFRGLGDSKTKYRIKSIDTGYFSIEVAVIEKVRNEGGNVAGGGSNPP